MKLFVRPEAPPPGMGDICEQCLRSGPGPKPPVCALVLCRRPTGDALTFEVTAPPAARAACEDCSKNPKLAPFCLPSLNCTLARDKPWNEKSVGAYKGWLEMSRIGADSLRANGHITKEEHDQFLDAYRQDWKSLLNQQPANTR